MTSAWRQLAIVSVTLLALFAATSPCETRGQSAPSKPHLERLGVAAWHARGLMGRGVTIAILDSGFRGYREQIGKALPHRTQAKSFRVDGNLEAKDSIHGLLCAEVVHTLAPDAALVIANWEPDQPDSFLRAVKWCREQGASILVCSIVVPGWSDGRGGGGVHTELAKMLENSLFFASAGNLAQRHWNGRFTDAGHRVHEWKRGRTDNSIRPWGNQPVSVELTASKDSTYRLSLIDERGQLLGREQPPTAPDIHGRAVRFQPEDRRSCRVQVELVDGPGGAIRLIVLGGELEIATADDAMVFPGDGAEIIAVGAVTSSGSRLLSSSTGKVGGAVKPECVAPVPFPSAMREAPFAGTSAAAPQAAGIAALLWSRRRAATASEIRDSFLKSCRDVGSPGPDHETGYGQIELPKP